jgi:hypothetical protein
LQDFTSVVELAENAAERRAANAHALTSEQQSREARLRRLEVAWDHDWYRVVERIACTIASRLGATLADASEPQPDVAVSVH